MVSLPVILFVTVLSVTLPTREEIIARAQSFADMTWFADSANTAAWEEMYERYGCEEHLIRCPHTLATQPCGVIS